MVNNPRDDSMIQFSFKRILNTTWLCQQWRQAWPFQHHSLSYDNVESGRRAGEFFAAENVDLIFCDVTTYVQSAFVLPVAQRCRAHMVLAALQMATKIAFTPQGRLEIFYDAGSTYERKLVFTPSATVSCNPQTSLRRASSRLAPWAMSLAIIES